MERTPLKWFTDSQAVSLIVDSGSMKEHLHQLAVDIFHTAKKNNIEIEVERIPCSLRVSASKDQAKLEIDPKIKILKLSQNKAYRTPD